MKNAVFAERLTALRQQMASAGLDGFIVPKTDEFQNEYVPPSAERIKFLSGFTGSAGSIVVLKNEAAFFTDGRYTIQASKQVDPNLFALHDITDKTPATWLAENAPQSSKIGFDPWLHSVENADQFRKALAKANAQLVPVEKNLVDLIWKERPAPPAEPVSPLDIPYAGKTSSDKREEIAASLKEKKTCAAILTDPASVAWLLNVRGNDVSHTPLPLSRAIIHNDASVEWFIEPSKVPTSVTNHVGNQVKILPLETFEASLTRLATKSAPVQLDLARTPSWIMDALRKAGVKIERGEDPCALPRAVKNKTELAGMRAANERDSAAVTNFLAWLDAHWENTRITEIDADTKLLSLRQTDPLFRDLSFATISGTGEHGAIVHYEATEETNAVLSRNQLYLVDSGGQYLDGTTDVTRTVALGAPSAEMRQNYTRVLKGHIALATARFPQGTTGADLEVLARQYLWSAGLDYSHSTGHGVGSYLNVHEGPQGISKRNRTVLQPGMVVSNEPGYYKEGAYGIRIENLMEIVECEGYPTKTLRFETLTLVPLDIRLIDATLLIPSEVKWINEYHERIRTALRSKVENKAWLDAATKSIEV